VGSSLWDGVDDDADAAPDPAPELPEERVWVRDGHGVLRLVPASRAEREGLEVDTRPPRGFVGRGHGGVRREFMKASERAELFEKTGVPVEDRADARAAFAAKGLREAERGEHAHEMFDALRECAETGQLDERFTLAGMDLFGDYERAERRERERGPTDYVERFRERCARAGIDPREVGA
jgi:hypothetical protein